jgi:hypothetical protein
VDALIILRSQVRVLPAPLAQAFEDYISLSGGDEEFGVEPHPLVKEQPPGRSGGNRN